MRRSPTPPLHLIHMSICLLSMPLSKDYWCPAFDIWHIMCHHVSSNELTRRRRGKILAAVSSLNRLQFLFSALAPTNIEAVSIMASAVKCYLTSAGLCMVLSGVSLHMSSRQVILSLILGGRAHNSADIKFLKCKAKVISSSVSYISASVLMTFINVASWFNINLMSDYISCVCSTVKL